MRFKTEKELKHGIPELINSVIKQLEIMAKDCINLPESLAHSYLLANNSKEILNIESIQADPCCQFRTVKLGRF